MRSLGLLLRLLLVCVSAGGLSANAADKEGSVAKSYACQGVVQQVFADQRHALIHHQAIAGFMPEMTMDFSVKNTNELGGVGPGAEITFSLLVSKNEAWIEGVHCIGHVKVQAASQSETPGGKAAELKAGDRWPDGELVSEDERHVRFSDFRGRTVAVNFFFTRCPLPDFCPRMNREFAEARKLLPPAPQGKTNYLFLSVSFDPETDTPERLAAYARMYRDDGPEQWLFAAATPEALAHLPRRLGLSLQRQGDGITHNLRTVVLDPQGRVYRQFDGNNWTPEDLAGAMKEADQQRIPARSQ
jgi:protein SCO1/2